MRSLKECYEIAKQHHYYWVGGNRTEYMCFAISDAQREGKLTVEEASIITADVQSLVIAIEPTSVSLRGALTNSLREDISHTDVKNYWDKYIDNMENQ